ncbi:MAG: hypothetical protein WA708_20100 [Acidobacteriaceae bacterium]
MLRFRYTATFALMLVVTVSSALSQTASPSKPSTGMDVLRAMHDRYASTWYKTVSFTEIAAQPTAGGAVKSEKWYEEAKLPGLLRIDVGVPATDTTTHRRTMLFVNGIEYVHVPGQAVQKHDTLNLLLVLGFDVYRQPVEKTAALLRSQGFDLSRAHTLVWHGRKVYVVGAAPGDLKSKQFWVDAQRLLFVRLIDPAWPGMVGTIEAFFSGYQKLGGGWIATEVTVNRNGKLLLHEKYADLRANVSLPDTWFDPASLK